jgi:hypothetical protein
VYNLPWYVARALTHSNGRLGEVYIGPNLKLAVGDETSSFGITPDSPVALLQSAIWN